MWSKATSSSPPASTASTRRAWWWAACAASSWAVASSRRSWWLLPRGLIDSRRCWSCARRRRASRPPRPFSEAVLDGPGHRGRAGGADGAEPDRARPSARPGPLPARGRLLCAQGWRDPRHAGRGRRGLGTRRALRRPHSRPVGAFQDPGRLRRRSGRHALPAHRARRARARALAGRAGRRADRTATGRRLRRDHRRALAAGPGRARRGQCGHRRGALRARRATPLEVEPGVRIYEDLRSLQRRLAVIQGVVVAAMVLVTAYFWHLQVLRGRYYRELAENNRLRTVPIPAPRGPLFDRYGRILAENRSSFNVVLTTEHLDHLSQSLGHLRKLLDIDVEAVRQRLNTKG